MKCNCGAEIEHALECPEALADMLRGFEVFVEKACNRYKVKPDIVRQTLRDHFLLNDLISFGEQAMIDHLQSVIEDTKELRNEFN